MLSSYFGSLIREARLAKGFTQAAIATEARVSRSIVSRLEQGNPGPVQTDILDRLLTVLGIDPAGAKPHPAADALIEERRRARLEHQGQLDQRRIRHLRLAAEFAGDPKQARRLIAGAKQVVKLWSRNKTCSPLYIRRWSCLLDLPPRELAVKMASLGEWEDAMFQNTPWNSAWT
ncbi:MAG: helix-turn-helix domain-containing protein [Burkholderiales bacterium]